MEQEPAKSLAHVLVVEDEPDHLMAVEMILRGVPGIIFHGAADTREAEATLEVTPIDVVLLDLALPGEDGISFAKRITSMERYRNVQIIAFSAFPRQVYEERAMAAGCVAYIDKPFQPRALVDLVRQHLPSSES